MSDKGVDKEKETKRHWWSDGISIDENRFSVLVVMAVVGFGYSLFSHYETGDITTNLLELVKILILGIVGTNVAGYVAGAIRGKREDKSKGDYNSSEQEYFDDGNIDTRGGNKYGI